MKNSFLIVPVQLFVILTAILFSQACRAESLYVFHPLTIRTLAMEKKMAEACPGFNIILFRRYQDFKLKVNTDHPNAILTNTAVLETLTDYKVKLKGVRNKSADVPFVFLYLDKDLDVMNRKDMTVGMFDILGREGMKHFVDPYFKFAPKIKRVTKVDDMLTLLTLNMVDAILVPEIYVDHFKQKSKMEFFSMPLDRMQIGIANLALKEGVNSASITSALKILEPKIMELLGVDNWID